MDEYNSVKASNLYPNSNAVPGNAIPINDRQQFRLDKITEVKDFSLLRLEKENEWVKIPVNILLFLLF